MRLEYDKREKLTGIFVIGAMVMLFVVVLIIGRGRSWFKSYISYYTTFDESYNLKVNSDVKLYKADIGKIKKITPADNRVKIELLILKEFASRIREGTVITVESPTFIGSEYISVYPGSPDGILIPENGVIASREKKSLSDIMAEFEIEKTVKMLIKTIQDFAGVAEALQKPSGPLFSAIDEFGDTFANLRNITASIDEGKGTIGELINSKESIHSINNIIDTINEATLSLKRITDNIEKGSKDVPEITDTTVRGIEEIREGVKNIDRLVKSLERNFLIKRNLPKESKGENIDAGLR